jgi:hypothetical protein
MLRNSQGVFGIPHVHPGMHLLRSTADSAYRPATDFPIGDYSQAPCGVEGLDGVGARGAGNTPTRKRLNGPWPGAIYGVRAPDPEETSLSWGEVHLGMQKGIL